LRQIERQLGIRIKNRGNHFELAGPDEAIDRGRRVLEELRDIDEVAYLRFASVYKDFAGASDFSREVQSLEKRR